MRSLFQSPQKSTLFQALLLLGSGPNNRQQYGEISGVLKRSLLHHSQIFDFSLKGNMLES